ncbi:MAG: hypothetical protein WED00_18490 [Aquisalimonadaceae bacterium]
MELWPYSMPVIGVAPLGKGRPLPASRALPTGMLQSSNDLYIIDPPVGPFSNREDLLKWRQELKQMPLSEAREDALMEVEDWLR